jgi:lipopolysaccharide export system protein LptC
MEDNTRGPLKVFSSRRTERAAHGMGYTLFVRLARIALPLTALVIMGIVFTRLSTPLLQKVEMVPSHDKTEPGRIELLKAQYEGVDSKGRPYELIADKASRAMSADDTVLLDGLKASITLEDGTWLAVHAKNGSYAARAQHLSLAGDVVIFHDSGYEMHLEDVDIDLKSRQAVTTKPVHGQGPMGAIAAEGLEVIEDGDRVVFAGPVKLTFYHLGGRG